MTNKTRLYLDVDGVLNADLSKSPQHWGYGLEGTATADGYDYKIRWAPELIERLYALEDVEIVWTTTWREDATKSLADLLGFGHSFRVLHPDRDPGADYQWPSIKWKIAAIEAEQREDPSPFIHVDDEIIGVPAWEGWVLIHGGLAISPHPLYGITRKHMDSIEEYVAKQKFLAEEQEEESA